MNMEPVCNGLPRRRLGCKTKSCSLRDDPVSQWRDAFYGSRRADGDWMIKVKGFAETMMEIQKKE